MYRYLAKLIFLYIFIHHTGLANKKSQYYTGKPDAGLVDDVGPCKNDHQMATFDYKYVHKQADQISSANWLTKLDSQFRIIGIL
jgi:hypothetical protein